MGLTVTENPKRIGRTDISDLNENAIVVWQHRNYVKIVLIMGLIFPAAVAGLLWNDWVGGFVYAGILRVFFVQQASKCLADVFIVAKLIHNSFLCQFSCTLAW
jgi:stearoyl-CoA desaturase (Delta-9 desaturase)